MTGLATLPQQHNILLTTPIGAVDKCHEALGAYELCEYNAKDSLKIVRLTDSALSN